MNHPLVPYLWAAGGLHLLIASVNFFAPKKLHYRENLARVSPIVREVFIVQNVYIVLSLVAFAAICFMFASDLAGQSALGRFLSGYLAFFWGLRLVIQLFFYDPEMKKQNALVNTGFILVFVYLTTVFALAALGSVE